MAPSVTVDFPTRPEMGETILVYPRLMRAVFTIAFQTCTSASACLSAASASSKSCWLTALSARACVTRSALERRAGNAASARFSAAFALSSAASKGSGSIWYRASPALTSAPSVNSRFWMSPLTWGRTSATRDAEARPGSSTVSSMGSGFTIMTPTSGSMPGGPPAPFFPQPADNRPAAKTATTARALTRSCNDCFMTSLLYASNVTQIL